MLSSVILYSPSLPAPSHSVISMLPALIVVVTVLTFASVLSISESELFSAWVVPFSHTSTFTSMMRMYVLMWFYLILGLWACRCTLTFLYSHFISFTTLLHPFSNIGWVSRYLCCDCPADPNSFMMRCLRLRCVLYVSSGSFSHPPFSKNLFSKFSFGLFSFVKLIWH